MLLEWFLLLQALVVAILVVMALIGLILGRYKDMHDPVWTFVRVFWAELLFPPQVMGIDTGKVVARRSLAPSGPIAPATKEDEFYGRVRKSGDGKSLQAELNVNVTPNAAADAVLGFDSAGANVAVTGEAGDSRSNKVLIELLARSLGVRPYQLTLTKGHYHARKSVQIQGMSNAELQDRLNSPPG